MDWIKIGDYKLATQIALTEEEHNVGLQNQPWPPPVMTFAFENTGIRKFWMDKTPSPLDIIFCLANKVVSIHEGVPLSKTNVGPNFPTDLVIELPYGMANNLNITVGSDVSVEYSLQTCAKSFRKFKI